MKSEMEELALKCELLTREITVLSENHASLIRALTMCQGLLAHMTIPSVREDFLAGHFSVLSNSLPMLQSLDRFTEIMLPLSNGAGKSVEDGEATVCFIGRLLSKDPGEPFDRLGLPFPIRQSYGAWREFFFDLMSSTYWQRVRPTLLRQGLNKSVNENSCAQVLLNVSEPAEQENLAVYGSDGAHSSIDPVRISCDRRGDVVSGSSVVGGTTSSFGAMGSGPQPRSGRAAVGVAGGQVSCGSGVFSRASEMAPLSSVAPVYVQSGGGYSAFYPRAPRVSFFSGDSFPSVVGASLSASISGGTLPSSRVSSGCFERPGEAFAPSRGGTDPYLARLSTSRPQWREPVVSFPGGVSPPRQYAQGPIPVKSSRVSAAWTWRPSAANSFGDSYRSPADFTGINQGRSYRRPRSGSVDSAGALSGSEFENPQIREGLGHHTRVARAAEPADLSLLAAIKQLRVKEPVAPRKFNPNSGKSLERFLLSFERYFDAKFEGSEWDKSMKLGTFLEGSVLKAYEGLDGTDLPYSQLKPYLLDWYGNVQSAPSQRSYVEFQKAVYDGDGSLGVYCTRLEQLALKAFPGNSKEREQYLCRKFRSTVPSSVLAKLENALSSFAVLGTRRFSWNQIRSFAEGEDRLANQRHEDQLVSGRLTELPSTVYFTRQHLREPRLCPEENDDSSPSETTTSSSFPVRFAEPESAALTVGARPKSRAASGGVREFRARDRRRSSPPGPQQRRSPPMCAWCGRLGHTEANCWLKVGACMSCGDQDHDTFSCPRSEETKPVLELRCSLCNGEHLGKDCTSVQPGAYLTRSNEGGLN